jgi:DNA-binding transcriptional ArsR family regulator
MSSGINSLHKILKDRTRRKIVLLLNEKGAISYTDLMDTLGFVTTGLLNYHLKVLGDLLTKNELGQYTLNEKGKLASKMLVEFPEDRPISSQGKPKWWRTFWIGVSIVTLAFIALNLLMYFLGYIDFSGLYQNLLWNFVAVGIAYMIQHILKDVLSKKIKLVFRKPLKIFCE